MLSLAMKLRIVVLTLGGIAFSAAVIMVVPIVTTHMVRIGEVTGPSDVVSELLFFVLASILLAIASRAALRTWRKGRDGGDPFLGGIAKAAPLAMVVGIVVGVIAATSIIESHAANLASLGQMTCRDALGWSASEAEIAACEPHGVACYRQESKRRKREKLGFSTLTGAERPEAICVTNRLRAGSP